jgi:hypothetical protein
VAKLSQVAADNGMLMGLKNAQEVVGEVASMVQFAVNEECAASGDCSSYNSFVAQGKPVYHIEYPSGGGGDGPSNGGDNDRYKAIPGKTSKPKALADYCVQGFSTVMKNLSLDGYVQYCDGSVIYTPTTGDSNRRMAAHGHVNMRKHHH